MSERTAETELLPFLHADRVVRTGVVIVALFFLGFLGWAASAPLESAVVSHGVIVAPSPSDGRVVAVAVRIRADDAVDIRTGMAAKVDLSAHQMRRLPILTGFVADISPRAVEDPRSGQTYVFARVKLDAGELRGHSDANLFPGMPVEVEIPTGAHTPLAYLIEPITEVMHNGMREK